MPSNSETATKQRPLDDKPLGMSTVAWRGCSCGACWGERRQFLGTGEIADDQSTLGVFSA